MTNVIQGNFPDHNQNEIDNLLEELEEISGQISMAEIEWSLARMSKRAVIGALRARGVKGLPNNEPDSIKNKINNLEKEWVNYE